MALADTLEQHAPAVGRIAWIMAWVALVAGQLHALSRHRTGDGKADLEISTTAVWAEPAGDLLSPLLDWGDPDLVYVTYGKIWLPVFVAFYLCAVLVQHRRRPRGFEKWCWRVVIFGYGYAVVGVGVDYWTQWTGEYNALFEIAFALTLPAVLIMVIGSSVLGVTLLLRRFRPRVPAVLLAATFPLALVIAQVTSLGNVALPIAFAFALLGRRIARDEPSSARVAVPMATPRT